MVSDSTHVPVCTLSALCGLTGPSRQRLHTGVDEPITGQERADRTRRNLVVNAAAEQFADHGWGTALSRIHRSAQTTMGALAFHFPTKDALADAVYELATVRTRTGTYEHALPEEGAPSLREYGRNAASPERQFLKEEIHQGRISTVCGY